ncbi:MAG: NAD(P)-dependent oxidoreductase [Dehalococcoidales bacterium]|nr:NAD(P)-dependent oxidoreductase [Dehalococcoidales bacterium]
MKETSKRVFITGGAGFLGQHLVRKFSDCGHEVCVYDLQSSTAPCRSIAGDILDTDKLQTAIAEHDIIIHLVGLIDAAVAQKDPSRSFELNVLSLQNVLEACRICDDKKLIFPSSAAVYGVTEDLPIKENFPVKPTNIYSWHKYVCEQMIRGYHHNFGINFFIIRISNAYGKGNKGVINTFIEKAKKGEVIESFAPHQYRDFIYVGDVAEALYKAAIYEKATNRIVNVGSGQGWQITEILDLICEIFPEAKWVRTKRELVTYDSILDITLAKILLDFEPHTSRDFMKKVIMEEMV